MSIAKEIMELFDNQGGTEIKEPVRSRIMTALKNWETIITPEFLENPSPHFKSVVRFYRSAIGVESNTDSKKDGKLLGCSRFSFYDTEKWHSVNEAEKSEERQYTLENNNNKFSEFSGIKISSKTWADYQINPDTISSAISLLDTYLNGILTQMRDSLETKRLDNDELARAVKIIRDARRKIFMSSIIGGREPAIINGIQERTVFKNDIVKAIKELYVKHMESKVQSVMLKFQKTLSDDAKLIFSGKPGDASVINYNRFMGFKGGERNPDVGMCLRDVNKYFPWALDFIGDLDAKMAADVIEDKKSIPKKLEGTAEGDEALEKIIRKHVKLAIKKEFNLGPKDNNVVDFIEICNSNNSPALESLRKMSKDMVRDSDARSLFIDIAKNLPRDIVQFAYEANKSGQYVKDIMNPERIEIFNKFRTLKSNLVSMGVPESAIKLPQSLNDLNAFYMNSGLSRRLSQEITVANLSLFAHDAMVNIIFPAMGKSRRSMTTGNVFNTLYGDKIDLPSVVSAVMKNGDNRLKKEEITIEGKKVPYSDIYKMGDVADIPLPRIGNLRNHYNFIKGDDYIIEFPETVRDFYKSLTGNSASGESGEKSNLKANGELKKLLPVLGQRVISQNTAFLKPDNGSLKKSFLVKQRASGDIGHRTVAYVEVPVDKISKSLTDIKPSLSIVDSTMANPAVVEIAIRHLSQQTNLRIDRKAAQKAYRENLDEINANKPKIGIVPPEFVDQGITGQAIHKWIVDNNILLEDNTPDYNPELMRKTIGKIRERSLNVSKPIEETPKIEVNKGPDKNSGIEQEM